MKRLIMAVSISIVLALTTSGFASEVVYVQGIEANILSKPSLSASSLGKALRGDKLIVVEKAGGWYRVNYRDKNGWVAKILVAPNPPMKKIAAALTGEEASIEKEARRRASAVTLAAAARGLTEEDRKRLGQKEMADYFSLERLEAIVISESEVFDFMRKGK